MKDVQMMCLGGCCASIWILGDKRIPGPIDNIVSKKGLNNIIHVFNHDLENIFFHSSYTRIPQGKLANNDPELEFGEHYCDIKTDFKEFTIVHNDFENDKVKVALAERIQRLYDFIDSMTTHKNYYLVYSLCRADFQNGEFNKDAFDNCVEFFKEKGLLNQVIFIGQVAPPESKSIYKNHSEYAQSVIGKNYFLVKDLNIRLPGETTLAEASLRAQKDFDEFLKDII